MLTSISNKKRFHFQENLVVFVRKRWKKNPAVTLMFCVSQENEIQLQLQNLE